MITIDRAINGWIVTYKDEEQTHTYVFDDGETEENEANSFSSLLWRVKSLIGPSDSRYSAHRVFIEVRPGDKNENHPDNQEEAE